MTQAQDTEREETTPSLDVDSLLAIHRHDDGQVAVCRKLPGKGLEQLWMLTPDMLRGTFRAFQEWLLVNSYASTQAYFHKAPETWVHTQTGLPAIGVDKHRPVGKRRFGRVTENLRWLNCLSCDIDCGRTELDADRKGKPPLSDLAKVPWRDAQRRVEDLQDAGIIPAVSMYGYSGRGLYVIWLLHDDKNQARSAPAYNHSVVTWKALQKELIARVESSPLPVDHSGSLITQVYKIGGTLNPATGNKARFFITAQADKNQRLISYSLSEMAAALDLPMIEGDLPDATRLIARPAQYRKVKKPGSAPGRSVGHKAVHALRAQDLLTIQAYRRGFLKRTEKYPDGTASPGRCRMLRLYTLFLRGSGSDKKDALESVRAMAANMKPPWPDEPSDPTLDALVDSEYAKKNLQRWTNEKLLPLLGVSADMARELDLQTLVPPEVNEERHQARPLQADMIQARRAWLRDYITSHPTPGDGGRWTADKVRDSLTPLSPFPWNNRGTANQDLNAIGFKMRSRGGRPRKQAEQQ